MTNITLCDNIKSQYEIKGGENVRKYLIQLRKTKKLTQEQVAMKLGIATTNYNMIENGFRQKDMDLSLAVRLAKIFEISIDYIIAEEEKIRADA